MSSETDRGNTVKHGKILDSAKPRWYRRLTRPILEAVWYIPTDVTLIVYAPPIACLQILATAAKPSTERLHLRNLFVYGRRYHFLHGSAEGFRMETTSKIPWSRRGRTNPNAILDGSFKQLDDNLTQIQVSAQLRIMNIGSAMFVPFFLTPMFLVAPWLPVFRILGLIVIYSLAWIAHRYNAAIDAHDMIYFIEKALEDFMPKSVSELGEVVPHVLNTRDDFPAEWEKFYQSHRDES